MKLPLLLLPLVCGPMACLSAQSAPTNPPQITAIDPADPAVAVIRKAGEEQIGRLGNVLISEVTRTVATKGLVAAIELVHLKNFTLPLPVAGRPRVTAIKHTSLRLRNPANSPDEADQAALKVIDDALHNGEDVPALLMQRLDRAEAPPEWRVYRPISTMPLCVKCHGPKEDISVELRTALAQYYPEDNALEYTANSWRGLIRVSLAAPESVAR